MRKLTASMFMSLDGVVEAPDQWHFPYFNDEMGNVIGAAMANSDAMMMGRVNYEEWASQWPDSESEMAGHMNGIRKYVASNTLEEVTWENSTLIEGPLTEEVPKIKASVGKDIAISGSPTLVRSLLEEGLIDELHLMTHPVVVGKGKRLFEGGEDHNLELAHSEDFSTGVIYAIYRPAAD